MKIRVFKSKFFYIPVILLIISLISLVGSEQAFAEYTPTQPNVLASYNSATNQIVVSWDFDTLSDDVLCVLKGDIRFINNAYTSASVIASFIPLYYSVSDNPITFTYGSLVVEEVSCSGSFVLDAADTLLNTDNVDNYHYAFHMYLTYYVYDENEYYFGDAFIIDEVLLIYEPAHEIPQSTIDFACSGDMSYDPQIGNILYIDTTGIHGNNYGINGINCGLYYELESTQWVEMSQNEGVDILPTTILRETVTIDQTEIYVSTDYHSEIYSSLIEVGATDQENNTEENNTVTITSTIDTSNDKKENGGGSGDDAHNTRPTFGLDHNTFVQRVDGGLVLNGVTFDVDDNFYTAVPMQYFNVGEMQNFTAKVYAPKELRVMEFFFGIPEIGKWDKAEASVTFEFDYAGELETAYSTNLVEDNIINATSLTYSATDVYCKADDNAKTCKQISMELSFNEAPIGKVLAMQAIDEKRRTNIVYFNDGITMEGESLNESPTHIIQNKHSSQQTTDLTLTLTRTDKINDMWIDKNNGIVYHKVSDNRYERITPYSSQCNDLPLDSIMVPNRVNCNYSPYKVQQGVLALDVMEKLCPTCLEVSFADFDESFAYEFPLEYDSKLDDPVLIEKMKYEADRALEKWLDENH